MNCKKITMFFLITIASISQLFALEVAGKKLNVYGKAHLSIDVVNTDDPTVNNDGLSISSNSSRLGFKGEIATEKLKFIFQYEQELYIDEAAGELATRNTYAGLKGHYGQLILGFHDTPYKIVASKWGVFGDSVGERRAMLGAGYQSGNQLNERVKNMMMYQYKKDQLTLQALYAVDPEANNDGKYDDTNKNVLSFGFYYQTDTIWLALSPEVWKKHSQMDDGSALRIAVKYKPSLLFQLGLLYETINSETVQEWQRDAIGLNANYEFSKNIDVRVQYILVDSAKKISDSGASKFSFGVFHELDKHAELYFVYGATDNDANAKFQAVDGGHGDEVKTVNGGYPSAFSLGLVYKF